MQGPQDLGGRHGFGAVRPEPNEPVFHAAWETRVLGLTLAAAAHRRWTLDESRHARESLPPADYYASSYYAIWLKALENLLLRHGLVAEGELASGTPAGPRGTPPLDAASVPAALKGAPSDRAAAAPPALKAGDRVRTRVVHVSTHTRLPAYAFDKPGRIVRGLGAHVFPDANAHGLGERPQHLYTVRFTARSLFGDGAHPDDAVNLDLFEPYLIAHAGP